MAELFVDCRQGMGGDMFLAALADLGLDLAPLAAALERAGVPVELDAPVVRVNGFGGRRLDVGAAASQPLRHLSDILAIIGSLDLNPAVRERSARAFQRLGQVEAEAHGIPLEKVHFHEVGAVDTLVDVVGAFYGLDALGVTWVVCSPLPWFTGFVDCAHGRLPLPAPATLRLMEGKPVFSTHYEVELLTPTGALVLDQVADEFGAGPSGTIKATGRSFGNHDLGSETFGLRLVLVEP
ncbi:nickel pincer cofactor biosynthesis protein LarC [Desulfocurvus sp. DL9XJH121]